MRVLVLVAGINAVTFMVAGPFLASRLSNEGSRLSEELADRLGYALTGNIRALGDLNVARILQWPSWQAVEDAILFDSQAVRTADGRILLPGVAINPVGSSERPAEFDNQAVLAAAFEAMTSNKSVVGVESGRAVPIPGPDGIWGACWFRTEAAVDLRSVVQNLVPWYLLSTLLLTGVTFLSLRRLVLEPVENLAEGARHIAGGDFSKRLEESPRQDELAQLIRSFNEMTSTVDGFSSRLRSEVDRATSEARQAEAAAMGARRLAAMGELAAGIAHEINNPLGGLLNAVESLQRGKLSDAKRDQYLELLRDGLERIRLTVGQLLRFTPRETSFAEVDLCEVVADAMALVSHRAEREGCELSFQFEGAKVLGVGELNQVRGAHVQGARHDLGQALLNLLSNALDAIRERPAGAQGAGKVEILLWSRAGGYTLRVRDNGPGVTAEQLERVSDLFFSTKEVGQGTGLGLSVVQNAVAHHGGRMLLRSEPGAGFQVDLELPHAPQGGDGSKPRTDTDAAPGGEQ